MIHLTTGAPGAGKTLMTLYWVRQLQKETGRPVFIDGVKLTDESLGFGWEYCDATKWEELPDGSIIVIDEAQRVFRARGVSVQMPKYEEGLETHRHRGMDLFLITQHPSSLAKHVRDLIGSPGWYRHVKRMTGTKLVNCLEFNYCCTSAETPAAKIDADQKKIIYPKEVYNWYSSAVMHTAKVRIPGRLYKIGAVVLFIVCVVIYVFSFFNGKFNQGEEPQPQQQNEGQAIPSAPTPAREQNRLPSAQMMQVNYAQSFMPRIPGMPQSAPRYDEVTKPVTAPYPAACVRYSYKLGTCKCYSQQGTILDISEQTCMNIIRNGYFVDWDTNSKTDREEREERSEASARGYRG